MKGIFHFTVLVAAGETERAFSSKILESWGESSSASALTLGVAGHSEALPGRAEFWTFVGDTVIGGSPGGIVEFVGSTEPLGPKPVFVIEVPIFLCPFGILSHL